MLLPPFLSHSLSLSHEALSRIGKERTHCPYGPYLPAGARSLSLMGGQQPLFPPGSWTCAYALAPVWGGLYVPSPGLLMPAPPLAFSAMLCRILALPASCLRPTVEQQLKFLPYFEVALEPHPDLFIIWSLHTLPLSKPDPLEAGPF